MNELNNTSLLLAELPIKFFSFSQVLIPALIAGLVVVFLHGLLSFSTNKRRGPTQSPGLIAGFIYLLFLFLIAALGVSGLGSIIQFGHMSGYGLLIHIAAAGGFTFLLLAIAWFYLPWGGADPNRTSRFWALALERMVLGDQRDRRRRNDVYEHASDCGHRRFIPAGRAASVRGLGRCAGGCCALVCT